jgi:DNA-directed RNA polymerase specialized sigma24 family protein
VDEESMKALVRYTKALLALQVQALNKTEDPVKPEIVLARAGLAAREIAELLGKSPAAVAKALQRAGKAA